MNANDKLWSGRYGNSVNIESIDFSLSNLRTNHGHVVVGAEEDPDRIAGAFKAYATRALRSEFEFFRSAKIWTRGTSTRYLWKNRHVEAAIDYVKFCQEDVPFEFKAGA